MSTAIRWFWFSSPHTFYPLAGRLARWSAAGAAAFALAGLYVGFFVAPTDAQQGEVYRIIFIHVPAAWMSMFLYVVMAFWAAMGLAFQTRLSGMMARAIAPTGALFTFIALWTGALWGKPTWGTYWVWDARLTSELILLFLYLGFMALTASIDGPPPRRPRRGAARPGRRGEHSDHLLLGGLVEHPAPGRLGELHQGAFHGGDHAHRDAADGGGVLALQHRGDAGAGALHDRGTRGRKGGRMSGHAFFIAWAYGVAFAALAIEVLVLLRRKRKSEAKT